MEFVRELPDKKNIEKQETGLDKFFAESNFNKIEQLVKFFDGSKPFMLVNGFIGTGKSILVKQAMSFLKDEVIVLKYTCFETTVLDDILLEFFDIFKNLVAQNIIQIPKYRTENFTQKINAYFDSIDKPIVIVLESFEQALQSERQTIVDFLLHLVNSYNIKVVITARKFDYELFNERYEKIAVTAFDKGLFEKYLRSVDIKQIGPLSDELYKNTRGYRFYTELSVKVMKLKNYSLGDFLSEYSKSFLSFSDFIFREALSLLTPKDGHLFRFLTIMRHPVNVNLLKTLNLYDESRIEFFTENLILTQENSMIYLQDYYKDIFANSIADNIAVKIHKSCVSLYETQLPLKPFERDLLISRRTMRKEIEYHEMFIPRKPVVTVKAEPKIIKTEISEQKPVIEQPQTKEDTNEIIKNITFVFDSESDEIEIMDKIALSINNFVDISDKKQEFLEEIKNRSLLDIVNLARQAESKFDYQKAIMFYQYALSLSQDDDYYTILPTLYIQLAAAFKNISDWYNAVKYYELAIEFFQSSGDIAKYYDYKYEIANIYYLTFKKDKAISILKEILSSNPSVNLEIKSKLLLANITGIWQIKEIPKNTQALEKQVLAELYFKSAVEADRADDVNLAVKYFKKCIETSQDRLVNPYVSSSLTNLASIYDEEGKSDTAIKYLNESIRLDELSKNYNGIYTSSVKLAEIYSFRDIDKAIESVNRAKDCAVELDELFYIASSEVLLGDLYSKQKKYKDALSHYRKAKKLATDNFTKENVLRIEMRIKDILKVYNEG